MSHPNTERDERVAKIRRWRMRYVSANSDPYADLSRAFGEIDYLLSLFDSQAIEGNRHADEIAADIVREWSEHDMNEHYGSDYLENEFGAGHLEERIALALTDAATRMRDRCVQEIKDRLYSPTLKYANKGIEAAIIDWTHRLIIVLESLTLEQVEQENK